MKYPSIYKGWNIYFGMSYPITGRFQALRNGVSLCANTFETLKKMIDLRRYEKAKNSLT